MQELKTRFVSFLWNFGWVALSMFTGFMIDNLDLIGTSFHFSPALAMIVGLVLTQVSKAVRNKIVQ